METEFIWGLSHPSLLAGEGGYYLTMISSAIHCVKNLEFEASKNDSLTGQRESKARTAGKVSFDVFRPLTSDANITISDDRIIL